jgi:hypothetical protein
MTLPKHRPFTHGDARKLSPEGKKALEDLRNFRKSMRAGASKEKTDALNEASRDLLRATSALESAKKRKDPHLEVYQGNVAHAQQQLIQLKKKFEEKD